MDKTGSSDVNDRSRKTGKVSVIMASVKYNALRGHDDNKRAGKKRVGRAHTTAVLSSSPKCVTVSSSSSSSTSSLSHYRSGTVIRTNSGSRIGNESKRRREGGNGHATRSPSEDGTVQRIRSSPMLLLGQDTKKSTSTATTDRNVTDCSVSEERPESLFDVLDMLSNPNCSASDFVVETSKEEAFIARTFNVFDQRSRWSNPLHWGMEQLDCLGIILCGETNYGFINRLSSGKTASFTPETNAQRLITSVSEWTSARQSSIMDGSFFNNDRWVKQPELCSFATALRCAVLTPNHIGATTQLIHVLLSLCGFDVYPWCLIPQVRKAASIAGVTYVSEIPLFAGLLPTDDSRSTVLEACGHLLVFLSYSSESDALPSTIAAMLASAWDRCLRAGECFDPHNSNVDNSNVTVYAMQCHSSFIRIIRACFPVSFLKSLHDGRPLQYSTDVSMDTELSMLVQTGPELDISDVTQRTTFITLMQTIKHDCLSHHK